MDETTMSGDVTTYESIAGFEPSYLEKLLGFESGRLWRGFAVWALVDGVSLGDFVWGDQTMYSGGWELQKDINEYVPRADILRADLGKLHSYNEISVDNEINDFLLKECKKLNVRDGAQKIVKVTPVIKHVKRRFWLHQYPNSTISGTPQWTIKRDHAKKFMRIASLHSGDVFR